MVPQRTMLRSVPITRPARQGVLPDDRRAEVLNAGRAKEWFSDWVTKPLSNDADTKGGIALLRQSYDELHTQ